MSRLKVALLVLAGLVLVSFTSHLVFHTGTGPIFWLSAIAGIGFLAYRDFKLK